MSCSVGRRCSSNPSLLWLWYRLAATAPIRPLDWESPYASGAALKRQKTKKNSWKENLWLLIHEGKGRERRQQDDDNEFKSITLEPTLPGLKDSPPLSEQIKLLLEGKRVNFPLLGRSLMGSAISNLQR